MLQDLGWTRKRITAYKIASALNKLAKEIDFPGYIDISTENDSYGEYYLLMMEYFPSVPSFSYEKLRKIIELKEKLMEELE
ncbi:MAG: hypothetical protein ABIL37_01335 [candidate division WOR-3 bacterium]